MDGYDKCSIIKKVKKKYRIIKNQIRFFIIRYHLLQIMMVLIILQLYKKYLLETHLFYKL